ncbi:MAG: hypothetical protein EA428_02275 [Spirochaetaceae bacterium]|nr:MAG: hypothetical protein EA428_02275 [Spirochaetaceae bacterium]
MTAGTDQKLSFPEKLVGFLQKNRRTLAILLAVLVLGSAGLFGFFEYNSRRSEQALQKLEQGLELYDEIQVADDAAQEDLLSELRGILTDIRSNYSGTYAAARAAFVSAELAWDRGDYDSAAEDFLSLAQRNPRSHLASRALLLAGLAFEETGNKEDARESYQKLVDDHGREAPETPRALFALGRLAEERNDRDTARAHYERLVQDFSGAAWTNLARNRIIYFESQ